MIRKNTNPMVVQRATKKRRDKEDREMQLMEDKDRDPRRYCWDTGRYDQARIRPLIEDDE